MKSVDLKKINKMANNVFEAMDQDYQRICFYMLQSWAKNVKWGPTFTQIFIFKLVWIFGYVKDLQKDNESQPKSIKVIS